MAKKQGILWKRYQMPLVMLVLGIVLMVGGKIMTPQTADAPTTPQSGTNAVAGLTNTTVNTQGKTESRQLAQEIETLLCDISGVKEATVVITYEDSGQQEVEKDETSQLDQTKEADGQGGDRTVEGEQKQESTVYVEDAEGNRYPFVKQETYGKVRGVAVVVKGSYDESIREKIVRTLEVLLDVPTHKIQVIW